MWSDEGNSLRSKTNTLKIVLTKLLKICVCSRYSQGYPSPPHSFSTDFRTTDQKAWDLISFGSVVADVIDNVLKAGAGSKYFVYSGVFQSDDIIFRNNSTDQH